MMTMESRVLKGRMTMRTVSWPCLNDFDRVLVIFGGAECVQSCVLALIFDGRRLNHTMGKAFGHVHQS